MLPIVYAYPVYKFLFRAEQYNLEKSVLDCGAGGKLPPLSLFYYSGYDTTGIDISENAVEKANVFCREHNIDLNVNIGDMRNIKFAEENFSLVYSYNSIFHMKKQDISKSIKEMFRVLKPGGLLFINLLSVEDQLYGQGKKISRGEFLQEEGGDFIIHSFYEDEEADLLFNHNIVHKEKRTLDFIYEGKKIHQVYIDYIIKKNK